MPALWRSGENALILSHQIIGNIVESNNVYRFESCQGRQKRR